MEKLLTRTPLIVGTFCYINPTVPLLSDQKLFNLPGFSFTQTGFLLAGFGDNTITICRPSILGNCSTIP
jgi:hypothetical protein